MKKRYFTILMSVVLLFSVISPSTSYAAEENNSDDTKELQIIHELYAQRAALLLEQEQNQKQNKLSNGDKEEYYTSELKEIDASLERLGVDFLTDEQVKEFMEKEESQNGVQPQVAVPSQGNVDWSTYRTTLTRNGKSYEVQRLVAQPNYKASNLKESAYKGLRSTYNWKAGVMNVAELTADSLVGLIPGSGLVVGVYDAAKGFVSGISKETVIEDVDIVYAYGQTTTAIFSYVKESGKSDSTQIMTYISTSVIANVGWQWPTFTYVDEYGRQVLRPNIVQGSRTINQYPPGYDNTSLAVDAFLNPSAQRKSVVNRVKYTGIEKKVLGYIYPVNPNSISHIY